MAALLELCAARRPCRCAPAASTNATRDGPELSTVWLEMPKQRSSGAKPQRRDPAATRKKLLAAARREFAHNGPRRRAGRRDRGARRRQQATGLSLFRRQGRAVSGGAGMGLRGNPAPRSASSTSRACRRNRRSSNLIESSFDHLARHPDFIVLLNDENRHGASHVRASRKLEDMHSPLVSLVSKILQQGVRSRSLPQGRQSGASLYLDRRPELFLLLQHADPVGDLRQRSVAARPRGAPAASTWSTW